MKAHNAVKVIIRAAQLITQKQTKKTQYGLVRLLTWQGFDM